MGTSNVFKLVREESTNIIIWAVGIIQGKTTMDGSERLFTVERSDEIYFWSTDNQKYYR
jgi:hypothetical protein